MGFELDTQVTSTSTTSTYTSTTSTSTGTPYVGFIEIPTYYTYDGYGNLLKEEKGGREGFSDFSPYAKAKVNVAGLKGDHYYDFKMANEALGLKSTPKGYTWHHVEDGMTMMLVPSDVHSAVRHTGGASLINKGLDP